MRLVVDPRVSDVYCEPWALLQDTYGDPLHTRLRPRVFPVASVFS